MTPTIRSERPADAAAIRDLLETSFATTAEARLVAALRDARLLQTSLVAEVDDRLAGYVAFSPVATAEAAPGAGLAPVAVRPEFRRRGIAHALIESGLAACRTAGLPYAVVLGDPAYYRRFGFVAAAAFGLTDAFGGGHAFQVLELRSGGIPRGAGLVRYAAEFAIFAP